MSTKIVMSLRYQFLERVRGGATLEERGGATPTIYRGRATLEERGNGRAPTELLARGGRPPPHTSPLSICNTHPPWHETSARIQHMNTSSHRSVQKKQLPQMTGGWEMKVSGGNQKTPNKTTWPPSTFSLATTISCKITASIPIGYFHTGT